MTILDRYFGAQSLSALAKTVVSLVMLFILIDLLTRLRSDIAQNDVPFLVVVTYYLSSIPMILCRYQIAALAMLVSSLLVLGSAAQNNEIVAALAGGIGLFKIVRMPVLVAAGLAVAVFGMEETVGPIAAASPRGSWQTAQWAA